MDIKVHSLWLAQDDPKKNTAVISSRRGDIILHKKINTLPKKGIILEPLCGKIFGPEDHYLLNEQNGSLVGLDCSWKQIEPSVEQVMRRTRLKPRMLPLFLAANPVNWGKPGKLTTIEALAAATYLVGNKEQASKLLSGFRWGERFLELNHEPLEEYSSAKSSSELVELQFEFFDLEHLRSGDGN
jgi:pre-rRNA-processing protein TSR3